jgi:hypothetical protein
MNDQKPSSKYEILPGLWVGSEIGDINREIKRLVKRLVEGDERVLPEITRLSREKEKLMMPKSLRNDAT